MRKWHEIVSLTKHAHWARRQIWPFETAKNRWYQTLLAATILGFLNLVSPVRFWPGPLTNEDPTRIAIQPLPLAGRSKHSHMVSFADALPTGDRQCINVRTGLLDLAVLSVFGPEISSPAPRKPSRPVRCDPLRRRRLPPRHPAGTPKGRSLTTSSLHSPSSTLRAAAVRPSERRPRTSAFPRASSGSSASPAS